MSDSSSVTIRGQYSDDWESLLPLLTLPELIYWSVDLPYPSEDAFRERYSTPPAQTHTLMVETGLSSGRKQLVGAAWLHVQPRRRRHIGELSLVVHPDSIRDLPHRRLLEAVLDLADKWLGLRRVEVIIFADDAAALALYEEYGFAVEATLRRYALRDGVLCDAVLLARLGGRNEQD